MMEVVVTTGAISRANLQSNHHHQQTKSNIQFFYRPDTLPFAQRTVSKHWRENITFHVLAYPKFTWGLLTLSLTTISSWLPSCRPTNSVGALKGKTLGHVHCAISHQPSVCLLYLTLIVTLGPSVSAVVQLTSDYCLPSFKSDM